MTLFDPDFGAPVEEPSPKREPRRKRAQRTASGGTSVRVVPDVLGVPRSFDYIWPTRFGDPELGAVVRITLSGRNVRAWVTEIDPDTPSGIDLVEINKVTGMGPDAETLELCRWAAWRWAGRLPSLLRVATPDRVASAPSRVRPRPADLTRIETDATVRAVAQLLDSGAGTHLLTVSPDTDPVAVAAVAAARSQSLFICASVPLANVVHRGLGQLGCSAARWPAGFAAGAGGHTIVGGRGAVFARMPKLGSIVVWDEHDEALQSESSPTWHAREVAIERARRLGIPCLLVSPIPSPDALAAAQPAAPSAAESRVISLPANLRRSGWGRMTVIDRRTEDVGRSGLFSQRFVKEVRSTRDARKRVLCVLNRLGRARLVACASCGTTADCETCGAAAVLEGGEELSCQRCDTTRPVVCTECGATRMKLLRPGVTKAAVDLAALLGEPVLEVSSTVDNPGTEERTAGVLLGTEAVLHRVSDAGLVAFLDFDQELLSSRYRASEEALALLVRASRLVGGRGTGRAVGPVSGGILVQTRLPDHPVLRAAVAGDPAGVSKSELERRAVLRMPPASTVAAVGGPAAGEWVERLGHPDGVEISGGKDGWWLIRSDETAVFCDAAAGVERPAGTLRLRVDPMRLR